MDIINSADSLLRARIFASLSNNPYILDPTNNGVSGADLQRLILNKTSPGEMRDYISQNNMFAGLTMYDLKTTATGARILAFVEKDPVTGVIKDVTFSINGTTPYVTENPGEALWDVANDIWIVTTGLPGFQAFEVKWAIDTFKEKMSLGVDFVVDIVGHSLGGNNVQWLKTLWPEEFGNAASFEAPGVGGVAGTIANLLTVGTFQKAVEALSGDKIKIIKEENDIAHLVGVDIGHGTILQDMMPELTIFSHGYGSLRSLLDTGTNIQKIEAINMFYALVDRDQNPSAVTKTINNNNGTFTTTKEWNFATQDGLTFKRLDTFMVDSAGKQLFLIAPTSKISFSGQVNGEATSGAIEFIIDDDGKTHLVTSYKDGGGRTIMQDASVGSAGFMSPTLIFPDSMTMTASKYIQLVGNQAIDYVFKGNEIEDIMLVSYSKTILTHFGTMAEFLAAGNSLSKSFYAAAGGIKGVDGKDLPTFFETYRANLSDKMTSVVSSAIQLQLHDILGDGPIGGVINAGAGAVLEAVVRDAFNHILGVVDGATGLNLVANGFNLDAVISIQKDGSTIVTTIGDYLQDMAIDGVARYIGSTLAQKIVTIDSLNDQIGVMVATFIAQMYLPPGVAEFVGTIVGDFVFDKILDDILGVEISFGFSSDRYIYFSMLKYNGTDFVEDHKWIKNENQQIGNSVLAMRDAYLAGINGILDDVGGRLDPWILGKTAYFGYSHHYDAFSVNWSDTDLVTSTNDLNMLVKTGLVRDIERLKFLTGDLMKARAIEYWASQPGHTIAKLDSLSGIQLAASNYRYYLDNQVSIDALIIASPTSAQAKLWLDILAVAKTMNLDKPYTTNGLNTDDLILTASGDDVVNGAAGNDTIKVYGGNDTVYGGPGHDKIYGGFGNDLLLGDDGNDTIYGEVGNDRIWGWTGTDQIYGGDGDDVIDGGEGADTIDGGNGYDILSYAGSKNGVTLRLNGSAVTATGGDAQGDIILGIEAFIGSEFADYFYGSTRDDIFYGGSGNDTILGGGGSDRLFGDTGNDTINGEDGDDFIWGWTGNDTIRGGAGNDTLGGEDGDDTIYGDDGNDIIYSDGPGSKGNDTVYGSNGADLVKAGDGNDIIYGGNDNDTLYGEDGDDKMWGDAGDDLLNAGAGDDILDGGAGNDILAGYAGNDRLLGGAGNDSLYGLMGDDYHDGGDGDDIIYADDGNDIAYGGAGNDRISGWNGNDKLYGDAGDDIVIGENGDDQLWGGAGNDTLYGDRMPTTTATSSYTEASVMAKALTELGARTYGLLYAGDGYTTDSLKAATHEMLIINPAKFVMTGPDGYETLWTKTELQTIQQSGKKLIGYLDIAKINEYTGQWKDEWDTKRPDWLAETDPAYPQTHNTYFWKTGWKQVLCERIDTIIKQGFDGLFLDDIVMYFSQKGENGTVNAPENARRMRDLIIDLHAYADTKLREVRGANYDVSKFKLILNGSPYLLDDTSYDGVPANQAKNTALLNAVDAMMLENFFSNKYVDYINQAIDDFGKAGVMLLSIDTGQVTLQQRIEIMKQAIALGILPYATEFDSYSALNEPLKVGYGDTVSDGNDILTGGDGADKHYGGNGIDRADYADATTGVIVDLVTPANNTGFARGDTYVSIENLGGSAYGDDLRGDNNANTIWGQAGNDILSGRGGNDTLYGGDGNDTLRGGAGADILDGGNGIDTASYRDSEFSVTVDLQTPADNRKDALGDRYISIENIEGSRYHDDLRGDNNANTIWGMDGDDVIRGRGGNDSLFGETGSDHISGGDGDDNLNGGAGDDILYGDAGNDTLIGDAGFDILYGGDGNDYLAGGKGDDTLTGGKGDDRFRYEMGDGFDTFYDNGGADTIILGTGLTRESMTLMWSGRDDLDVYFDGVKAFQVANHFNSLNDKIEFLQFSDNSIYNLFTAFGGAVVPNPEPEPVLVSDTGLGDPGCHLSIEVPVENVYLYLPSAQAVQTVAHNTQTTLSMSDLVSASSSAVSASETQGYASMAAASVINLPGYDVENIVVNGQSDWT